jgi:hypothetical protein
VQIIEQQKELSNNASLTHEPAQHLGDALAACTHLGSTIADDDHTAGTRTLTTNAPAMLEKVAARIKQSVLKDEVGF